MKISSSLTLFIFGLLFSSIYAQNKNNNSIIICNQIETTNLKDHSILFVSNTNNTLKINDGKAVGIMPKGDKKIALIIDNTINDKLSIEIKDEIGKTFLLEINSTDINCISKPYSLESAIKSIEVKNSSQVAVFNVTEYINSSK